jgi:hypothetical protein
VADPREINRRGQQEVSLDEALKMWVVSPDHQAHIAKLQELIDGGVTHIYVHAGNDDQMQAINFYHDQVLPHVRGERCTRANRRATSMTVQQRAVVDAVPIPYERSDEPCPMPLPTVTPALSAWAHCSRSSGDVASNASSVTAPHR